ncbi:MAG: septation protein SepH [Actinomycetota bacterium]
MTELRFIGRANDGEHLELSDNEGNKFTVRVSDSLRASVNERRLTTVVESAPTFSIKEIQARLRAGESYADVSHISGLSLEKIERYASPILQERAWIIELAEKASPKGTSLPLSELVIQRLAPRGVNMNQISWNIWRLDDGTWHLVLSYPSRDGQSEATWVFDSNKRTLASLDDGARWINGEEIPSKQAPRNDRMGDHGVLFPVEGDSPQPPRLVAVRTDPMIDDQIEEPREIAPDAKKDGVTKRISIPSWDDIMFGRSKKKDEEEN